MKSLSCAMILLVSGCTHATAPAKSPSSTALHPEPAAAESFTSVPASAQGSGATDQPDPLQTDPDKYQVILENEHVRVLSYHDTPGAKTNPHYHRAFVLYALGPFRRKLVFADGSLRERDFKAGDVIWMPAQVHTGENTGTTDTDVVLVESKAP